MKGTLFPARFGQSEEFAHLAVAILENQMLNGTGGFSFPEPENRQLNLHLFPVIRLDGGSRMAKM